jgi:DNA-3-methyladenine glycosylase I
LVSGGLGITITIMTLVRCGWAVGDPLVAYHDEEWGMPLHDDRRLFELLVLEAAQAGLSWITVLKKREHYRAAFDDFDPKAIAAYDRKKVQALLRNPGIIRNRRKIESVIHNAQAFLGLQGECGSFDAYIWQFVGGHPKKNRWRSFKAIPNRTRESDAMSKDLQRRGFTFVGPVICYSFMQAAGMVNDHTTKCFRYSQVAEGRRTRVGARRPGSRG